MREDLFRPPRLVAGLKEAFQVAPPRLARPVDGAALEAKPAKGPLSLTQLVREKLDESQKDLTFFQRVKQQYTMWRTVRSASRELRGLGRPAEPEDMWRAVQNALARQKDDSRRAIKVSGFLLLGASTAMGVITFGIQSFVSPGVMWALNPVLCTMTAIITSAAGSQFIEHMQNRSRRANYNMMKGEKLVGDELGEQLLGMFFRQQQGADGRVQGSRAVTAMYTLMLQSTARDARAMVDRGDDEGAASLLAGKLMQDKDLWYEVHPQFTKVLEQVLLTVTPHFQGLPAAKRDALASSVLTAIKAHDNPAADVLKGYYEPLVNGILGRKRVADGFDAAPDRKPQLARAIASTGT